MIVLFYFFATQQAHAPVMSGEIPVVQPDIQPKLSPEMANDSVQMIEITAPLPNTTLTSPITLTGRARGPWYFEASFPIELRDANNVLIAQTVGQAQ